jgi:predicted RNA binding protein YcfA (HicA-like mRNA interferase family)
MKKALMRAGLEVVRVKGSHHFMVELKDHTRWAYYDL